MEDTLPHLVHWGVVKVRLRVRHGRWACSALHPLTAPNDPAEGTHMRTLGAGYVGSALVVWHWYSALRDARP